MNIVAERTTYLFICVSYKIHTPHVPDLTLPCPSCNTDTTILISVEGLLELICAYANLP